MGSAQQQMQLVPHEPTLKSAPNIKENTWEILFREYTQLYSHMRYFKMITWNIDKE